MTYADQLFASPSACLAMDMSQKYHLTHAQMLNLAHYINHESWMGHIKHDEHAKMLAAKWCKAKTK